MPRFFRPAEHQLCNYTGDGLFREGVSGQEGLILFFSALAVSSACSDVDGRGCNLFSRRFLLVWNGSGRPHRPFRSCQTEIGTRTLCPVSSNRYEWALQPDFKAPIICSRRAAPLFARDCATGEELGSMCRLIFKRGAWLGEIYRCQSFSPRLTELFIRPRDNASRRSRCCTVR